MQLLQYKKKLSKIRIELFGSLLELLISPKTLVSSVIDQLKLHPAVETIVGFGLFIASKSTLTGLLLEPTRTFNSYRLKPYDILYFKQLPDDLILSSRKSLLADPKVIFLVIDSHCHGVKKTLKLQKDNTLAQVFNIFTQKNPVQNSSQYGLAYSPTEKEKPIFLDFTKSLEYYNISNMVNYKL